MHGRVHPNYCQIHIHVTILLVVDLCSSLAYFVMTHPLLIAGKLPTCIKTLVASVSFVRCSVFCALLRRVGGSNPRWTPQRSQHTITFANMAESVSFVRCSGCIQLT